MKQNLLEKAEKREAVIGVIGLGYVGLPLILRFAEVGFPVIGFDIDEEKISLLESGESYIKHISSQSIQAAQGDKTQWTSDFAQISQCDAVMICVPTPLTSHREPDISFIVKTMDAAEPYLRAGQLLSLESTTYPGTTDEVLKPYLDRKGFEIGKDYFLVYSPEREDPGNPNFTTQTIPRVCGGHTEACQEIGVKIYSQIIDYVHPVSGTRAAEMTKLLENIHRAVNIGLVNEMKVVADAMEIDIHEVIRAASTKPFGFTAYYPGPGLGGHCIPIDPFYLTWKAREYGLSTRFIELSGEVNTQMPQFVVDKVTYALNDRGKAVKGSKALILGIAYKKNVDDMRESPSVILMEKLRDLGAEVAYSDPYVPTFPKMREHFFELDSIPLTPENLESFDFVLLATDHDDFPYEMILEKADLIIDTRGKYKNSNGKVIKA